MASPSSSTTTFCFQCEDSSNSVTFRNGWRLRSGKFAQLCHRCASVYEYGRFCEIFHPSDDGWRDCESCGKLIHCGCIVSFNSYLLLDFGGIMCMDCSKKNFILARNRCLSHETPVPTEKSQLDATQTMIESQYRPRVTESKLQKISINCGHGVTPLFQKSLTATDADLTLSRLVIPKKCAEAYFPPLSGPHKIPINILDTDGKEWNFHFRFWPNSRSKMYVLEGLRDYMVSKKWQAGDVDLSSMPEADLHVTYEVHRNYTQILYVYYGIDGISIDTLIVNPIIILYQLEVVLRNREDSYSLITICFEIVA